LKATVERRKIIKQILGIGQDKGVSQRVPEPMVPKENFAEQQPEIKN
jgi:hypothetical protein